MKNDNILREILLYLLIMEIPFAFTVLGLFGWNVY